jgi:hypothetical protein
MGLGDDHKKSISWERKPTSKYQSKKHKDSTKTFCGQAADV